MIDSEKGLVHDRMVVHPFSEAQPPSYTPLATDMFSPIRARLSIISESFTSVHRLLCPSVHRYLYRFDIQL